VSELEALHLRLVTRLHDPTVPAADRDLAARNLIKSIDSMRRTLDRATIDYSRKTITRALDETRDELIKARRKRRPPEGMA
jgi:hypothetical protein